MARERVRREPGRSTVCTVRLEADLGRL